MPVSSNKIERIILSASSIGCSADAVRESFYRLIKNTVSGIRKLLETYFLDKLPSFRFLFYSPLRCRARTMTRVESCCSSR